jgi:hypothetical protein
MLGGSVVGGLQGFNEKPAVPLRGRGRGWKRDGEGWLLVGREFEFVVFEGDRPGYRRCGIHCARRELVGDEESGAEFMVLVEYWRLPKVLLLIFT